jgi:ABC-type lipoprotein release transport system permease subunit
MAYREVGMMDVDQVIRRWLAGEKIRAIARLTGTDRNTVRRIVRLAEEAGIVTAAMLLLVATLACCVPAWRAARMDPLAALRFE